MRKASTGSIEEPKIAVGWIAVPLIVLAIVLFAVGQYQTGFQEWHVLTDVAFLLMVLSLAAWGTDLWRPRLGRWFLVLTLAAVIISVGYWLPAPSLLTLLVVPPALAVVLINLRSGALTAAIESAALAGLAATQDGLAASAILIVLLTIWTIIGLLALVDSSTRQLAGWLNEYYQQGQILIEEARNRQAELRQAVDDLEHANRQLALLNQRATDLRLVAEEAQQTKSKFVARVSHEFRTPLNMIIGLTSLMIDHPEIYDVGLSPKMREDLDVVHRNCDLLAKMVNDVLDLTRLESDRLDLHRQWVNVRQIINSAAETVRPLLQSKHLTLHVSVPSDLPNVYCDSTRIEQVVLNLMSNAARYTDEGGVLIEASLRNNHLRVSVADTGPGIPEQDVSRIFEPFFQGEGGLWHGKGGSGLGLSISKRFIELHGGRLWLETEVGVGTTFSFEVPLSPPGEPVRSPLQWIDEDWIWRERQSHPVFAPEHYQPRFVVCDEKGDLAPALRHYGQDAEFVSAGDSSEATSLMRQSPAHGVIFNTADFTAAWSLLDLVRRQTRDTPIFACSVPSPRDHARSLGAAGHLVKPVTRGDLDEALHTAGRPVRKVLVVDDDAEARSMFCRMLQLCDNALQIVQAACGKEALAAIQEDTFDLVLLDIVMPDMDGWQVLEAMHHSKQAPIPTFFVSAQDLVDEPLSSPFMLVTLDRGLPLHRLVRCFQDVSAILLKPDVEHDQALP